MFTADEIDEADKLLTLAREYTEGIAWLEAARIEVLARFQQVRRDDEFAVMEISAELNWCDNRAANHMYTSASLVERLPQVVQALADGRIEMSHVWRFVDHTRVLSDEHASMVADRALPKAQTQTTAQLGRSLSRVVKQVDPKGCEERKAEAKKRRAVSLYRHPDDMANLSVFMPAPDATAIVDHLEYLAKKVKTSDDERSMDEIKVDIFTDLIFGKNPIKATVNVTVPMTTLMGSDDAPGELAGYGPITASTTRELAFQDAIWRRLVTDPINGTIKDYGRTTYRPPADLNDFVRARDVTCRFPGCRRRAAKCDLDHVTEYSRGGATNACNLLTLCRRHHRMRHESKWSYTLADDGTVVWLSPTGRRYIVEPDDLYLDHQNSDYQAADPRAA